MVTLNVIEKPINTLIPSEKYWEDIVMTNLSTAKIDVMHAIHLAESEPSSKITTSRSYSARSMCTQGTQQKLRSSFYKNYSDNSKNMIIFSPSHLLSASPSEQGLQSERNKARREEDSDNISNGVTSTVELNIISKKYENDVESTVDTPKKKKNKSQKKIKDEHTQEIIVGYRELADDRDENNKSYSSPIPMMPKGVCSDSDWDDDKDVIAGYRAVEDQPKCHPIRNNNNTLFRNTTSGKSKVPPIGSFAQTRNRVPTLQLNNTNPPNYTVDSPDSDDRRDDAPGYSLREIFSFSDENDSDTTVMPLSCTEDNGLDHEQRWVLDGQQLTIVTRENNGIHSPFIGTNEMKDDTKNYGGLEQHQSNDPEDGKDESKSTIKPNYYEPEDMSLLKYLNNTMYRKKILMDNQYSEDQHKIEIISFRTFCLSFFFLVYGMILSMMGVYLLPKETVTLFPTHQSLVLACLFTIMGAAPFLTPYLGQLSDASTFYLGRRRPFIVIGTLLSSLSFILKDYSSRHQKTECLIIAHVIVMIGLQFIAAGQYGLLSDIVPKGQQARVSGVIAMFMVSGTSFGYMILLMYPDRPFEFTYAIFVFSLVLSMCLAFLIEEPSGSLPLNIIRKRRDAATCNSLARRRDGRKNQQSIDGLLHTTPDAENPMTESTPLCHTSNSSTSLSMPTRIEEYCKSSFTGFSIPSKIEMFSEGRDIRTHNRNFYFVYASRCLFYFATSFQFFLLYIHRDLTLSHYHVRRREIIAFFALLGQFLSIFLAIPMGHVADLFGKKMVLQFACLCILLAYCLLFYVDLNKHPIFCFFGFIFFYGFGNGCFIGTDTSLAYETVPNKTESSKSMGIWQTSSFLAATLRPLAWYLCFLLGHHTHPGAGYNSDGYHYFYVVSMSAIVICSILIYHIDLREY